MNELEAPAPLLEVITGTIGLIVIIFVHGTGVRFINHRFSDAWVRVTPETAYWRINLLLVVVVASLAMLHFVETMIWAAPIHAFGIIPNLRDAYYYVLESYTTLGEGNIVLPDHWRLFGPIIAMSGVFTFGWTGSILVAIMTEFGKLDRSRASRVQTRKLRNPDSGPQA